jgi:hypothetical protein
MAFHSGMSMAHTKYAVLMTRAISSGVDAASRNAFDRWGLVGGVVVADQVHIQLGRYGFVDRDKEFLELHRLVAVELGNHRGIGDVERREQTAHTVTGVVMAAPFGHAGHHR